LKPETKLCRTNELIGLRHEVLRQGKPISSCHFEGDNDLDTFHVGAFDDNKMIGCVSLMKKKHPKFHQNDIYQLRGMAVLKAYRHKKIGNRLLDFALQHLLKKNADLVWCNVRTSAVGFYQKNHFLINGDEFDIPDVGPHVLMYKILRDA
jgi:ribosomal protein S18 acetylase RimI-like enzyme